ncbi:MAG: GNAT family N-acetyltransferase [Candidatus Lokiarchaeia archaeon]
MSSRKRHWNLRLFKLSDEAEVMDLFRICFVDTEAKEKLKFDYWTWENKQNPDGHMIVVAEHAERLVGYFGTIFRRLKLGDKIVKAALSIDHMVHPQYRRQGMYSSADKLRHDSVEENGATIFMGFPNAQSRRAHPKEGHQEIFTIPTMAKIINFTPVFQAFLRNNSLSWIIGPFMTKFVSIFFRGQRTRIPKNLSINRVSRFDSRFDKLWASASKNLRIAGVRDSRRLNWRFIGVPHREYVTLAASVNGELQAYVVLRIVERRGMPFGLLVDMLAASEADEALLALINISEAFFLSKKVAGILCIMLPGWYSKILRQAGFIRLPKRLERTEWVIMVNFLDPAIDNEFFKNPRNWHMTYEDTDVL